jgi:hypothetical protein
VGGRLFEGLIPSGVLEAEVAIEAGQAAKIARGGE